MNKHTFAIREWVNYARTLTAATPGARVSYMPMGTCHWFKRIPAVASSPPGVLDMV